LFAVLNLTYNNCWRCCCGCCRCCYCCFKPAAANI